MFMFVFALMYIWSLKNEKERREGEERSGEYVMCMCV